MNFSCLRVLLAVAPLLLSSGAASAQQMKLPVIPLNIGLYVIQAEVATSKAEQERGMMQRKSMAQNEGMLFDLGRPALLQCMWMKDTLLPLSVAFIDETGKIMNIEEMQAQTEDQHCSDRKSHVRYALEMNAGWFKKAHVKPGAAIEGLPNSR
ncbi:MAG TPA: DUF192 domain-containing protein [Burkholderiaceae bacterium]|nr:DUF192 domain-containing protein [Burkholderiaceae bacterium]